MISCDDIKKTDSLKKIGMPEKEEQPVRFYEIYREHISKRELSDKFKPDTSEYFKTYVLQGRSKLIERELEDIKPSWLINKAELDSLNYHIIFEDYQSDFIKMNEFDTKKHDTDKTEIVHFFTYPFSVAKDKVLIGFKKSYKFHPKEFYKGGSSGYIVYEKINDKWSLIKEVSLVEY